MSILVDKNTKVTCQGFTGKNSTFHSEQATVVAALATERSEVPLRLRLGRVLIVRYWG